MAMEYLHCVDFFFSINELFCAYAINSESYRGQRRRRRRRRRRWRGEFVESVANSSRDDADLSRGKVEEEKNSEFGAVAVVFFVLKCLITNL